MIQECLICKKEVKHRRYSKNKWFCSRKCSASTKIVHFDEKYILKIKNKIKNNSVPNPTGCWIWNKSKSTSGYPKIFYKNQTLRGNRVSFMVFIGDIPMGMCVCHTCDKPDCLNPDHLYLGSHQDNVNDKVLRKRCPNGEKVRVSKLKTENVLEIRRLYKQGFSQTCLARKFKVGQNTVSSVVNHKTWKHL